MYRSIYVSDIYSVPRLQYRSCIYIYCVSYVNSSDILSVKSKLIVTNCETVTVSWNMIKELNDNNT